MFLRSGGIPERSKIDKKNDTENKPKTTSFFCKTVQKVPQKELVFRRCWSPFSYFGRFRRPTVLKVVPRPPRAPKSTQKDTKHRAQSAWNWAKIEPKYAKNPRQKSQILLSRASEVLEGSKNGFWEAFEIFGDFWDLLDFPLCFLYKRKGKSIKSQNFQNFQNLVFFSDFKKIL